MSLTERNVETLRRCVVVGGAGAVGGMFAGLLAHSGAQVCVIDTMPPLDAPSPAKRFECGDITAPDQRVLDELDEADLVLLAVPERVALAAVAPVADASRPGTLLAETLSVKSRIAAVVRAYAPQIEAVGLNPMFAPSLGIAGRPVAAVVMHDGPRASELLQLVSAWGGQVIRMDAEKHDRFAAATQVLTHAAVLAFGFALAELDVDIEELSAIAPPPHAMMLALLARITSGTPEVYWDIQSANPQAPKVREALARGVRRLVELTETGNGTVFAEALRQTQDLLGGELELYRDVCVHIFDRLPSVRSVSRLRQRSG